MILFISMTVIIVQQRATVVSGQILNFFATVKKQYVLILPSIIHNSPLWRLLVDGYLHHKSHYRGLWYTNWELSSSAMTGRVM